MDNDERLLLASKIRELDPAENVVQLLPPTGVPKSITYNPKCGITLHEIITRATDEELVRAYLAVHLVFELRYPADALEFERPYKIGRPTGKSAQVDVRITDTRDSKVSTFMLIEAKAPDFFATYSKLIADQLFAPGRDEYARGCRYIAWYSVDLSSGSIRDHCIVIDVRKYHEYKDWVEAGEPGHHLELPIEYGAVRKQKYVKGKTDLRTDVSRSELSRLQRELHNVLWGGGKNTDTVVFNNLLKILLAKIYDEKTTEQSAPYRFQIDLRDEVLESPSDITENVTQLYREALRYYFDYSNDDVQLATINENSLPKNKVAYVVERLEGISLIENTYDDDVLGSFFEAIVRSGFKQGKGQFFTHTNIVRFMLYALGLDTWAIDFMNYVSPQLPYIIDPSCGSGTFLIEAMKIVTKSVMSTNHGELRKSRSVQEFYENWFHPNASDRNTHNRWAEKYIYGVEDGEDLALATKVNMILHGDGNSNIEKADGLAAFPAYKSAVLRASKIDSSAPYKRAVNEQFDCVVANPPFSLKEEPRTVAEYGTRFVFGGQKSSENLFVERWYQLLRERGRLGVVLPDSVFDTNENLQIRLFLYRFFTIKAIVSLPVLAFQPYTPTKTSLLFATKKCRKDVLAWDDAWRKAAGKYAVLRKSFVVQLSIRNDRARSTLVDAARRLDHDWYPETYLLSRSSIPQDLVRLFRARLDRGSAARTRVARALWDVRRLRVADWAAALSWKSERQTRDVIQSLLRDHLPDNAESQTIVDLLEVTYPDIVVAATLNYANEPSDAPYTNAWWCFAEVTGQPGFNYDVFLAEVSEVGYKRTSKHPGGAPRPNELFRIDEFLNVITDTDEPVSILEQLRKSVRY